MKTKLLKKLRKRYTIAERNGMYKIIIQDFRYNDQTPFYMTLQQAIEKRRDHIIHFARNHYSIPK